MEAKIRNVLAADYPRLLLEVIVVSDASTDGTEAIARQFDAEGVRLVSEHALGQIGRAQSCGRPRSWRDRRLHRRQRRLSGGHDQSARAALQRSVNWVGDGLYAVLLVRGGRRGRCHPRIYVARVVDQGG